VEAKINSIHENIRHRIDVTSIPGKAIGRVILHITPQSLQPSILAASSMPRGKLSKKPLINQTANGRLRAICKTTTPVKVLNKPTLAKSK
jgi:hypothetical protein